MSGIKEIVFEMVQAFHSFPKKQINESRWYSTERKSLYLNCEFCGSNIRGEPQAVNLDGGLFHVCNSCARLGTPARVPRSSPMRRSGQGSGGGHFGREGSRFGGQLVRRQVAVGAPVPHISSSSPPPSSSSSFSGSTETEVNLELRPDYSRVIKEARERLGLSQEELGRKINEKTSVISHLETGAMKPSDALARKIEHALKVKLLVPSEEVEEMVEEKIASGSNSEQVVKPEDSASDE